MGISPGFGLKQIAAPTWEPIDATFAKAHCRILNYDADDTLIKGYITAAREYVEVLCKMALPQAQYQLTFEEFPGRQVDDYRPPTWRYGIIRMPIPPLVSIDLVEYVDPTQSTQPFTYTTLPATGYQVDPNTQPGRVAPAPFLVWPATNPLAFAAVRVTFTCGFTTSDLVPSRLKQAIVMLVGHLYENRECTMEQALQKVPLSLIDFALAACPMEYA